MNDNINHIRYGPLNRKTPNGTLLACGIKPSSVQDGVYNYTHIISTPTTEVKKSKVYTLPGSKSGREHLIAVEAEKDNIMEYTEDNTIDFSSVGWLIQNLAKEKDKLSTVKSLGPQLDIFNSVKMQILLNRASLKMLNINEAFNNIIGDATKKMFRFADLCCAPGGFTYTLQKLRYKNLIEAKLFTMHEIGTFLPVDDSIKTIDNVSIFYGDICNKHDRDTFFYSFADKVDFVLSDGGIDFTGQENKQEFYSQKLYISQTLLGLKILKPEGFMICKFFDTFLAASVNLLYALNLCFDEMKVCKIISSKSGNAEKYILFNKYKPNIEIIEFLDDVITNDKVIKFNDVNHKEYKAFKNYISHINKILGVEQLAALKKYTGTNKIPLPKNHHQQNLRHNYIRSWLSHF
ncbi:methyltransferase [Penaeus vannamei nudivirus]|nr:methyltransferase [Penaeus vannamei nucleopolyhedrovirus]